MEQCKNCIMEEGKEDLICCACSRLAGALQELVNNLPFVEKKEYECPHRVEVAHERLIARRINRCVCCGAVIPEGRQVCPKCEGGVGDGK